MSFSARRATYGERGERLDTVAVMRDGRTWNEVAVFELDYAVDGFLNGIVAGRDRLDRAASGLKAVGLSLASGRFVVQVSKENQLSTVAAGMMPPINVAAADLRGLLRLVDDLKPPYLTLLNMKEDDALRWTFDHGRAKYELFMPAAHTTGARMTSAFEPIKIVAHAKKAA